MTVISLVVAAALVVGQTLTLERPNIAGSWTLDTYLSDNPEQIARELRSDTGQQSEDTYAGGGERTRGGYGGGYGGHRGGGYGRGSGTSNRPRQDQLSPEDQKLLSEVTRAVQYPPPTLTIAQTDAAVTLTGAEGVSKTIHTDGKTEKEQFENGTVNRSASWQGPVFVVRYDIGKAGTLRYSYSIVPTTKQLLVRVNFERQASTGPFEIKLVYDATAKS